MSFSDRQAELEVHIPPQGPILFLFHPRRGGLWQPSKAFLALLLMALNAGAQATFATSEVTSPIRRLVTIANAVIAGLAILAVIYYAIKWIGGDEGAAKRIIGVIMVAVIALAAANFLGWATGRTEFDTYTN